LRHRRDDTRDLGGRPEQIVDQRVDRGFHLAPGAIRQAELDALAGLALAADDMADAVELLRHALVGGDDLVEGVRDLAEDAGLAARHAYREIAHAHGLQRIQELVQFGRRAARELPFGGDGVGRRTIGLKFANRFTVRLHGVSSGAGEPAQCHGRGGVVMGHPMTPSRTSTRKPGCCCWELGMCGPASGPRDGTGANRSALPRAERTQNG
jgi:hypothetical protein